MRDKCKPYENNEHSHMDESAFTSRQLRTGDHFWKWNLKDDTKIMELSGRSLTFRLRLFIYIVIDHLYSLNRVSFTAFKGQTAVQLLDQFPDILSFRCISILLLCSLSIQYRDACYRYLVHFQYWNLDIGYCWPPWLSNWETHLCCWNNLPFVESVFEIVFKN